MKQAIFQFDGAVPLQVLLENSLDALSTIAVRQETSTKQDAGWFRFINWKLAHRGAHCCHLVMYHSNDSRLFIDTTGLDVERLQLSHAELTKMTNGAALVESALYLAAIDNYIVYGGAINMNSQQLERHLNWLLKTAGVIRPLERITLVDPKVRQLPAEYKSVSSITFTTELEYEEQPKELAPADGVLFDADVRATGAIFAFLDRLSSDKGGGEFQIPLRSNEDKPSIGAKVELKTQSGKGDAILSQIADHFRHADNIPISVTFENGRTIEGDSLKVSETAVVECEGVHPIPESIADAMVDLHSRLVREEVITGH